MKPSVYLAAVSLSLPWLACEGVRKQATGMVPEARPGVRVQSFSKSVSMAPGVDGQLHSFTRETRTTQVGEGAAAQVSTIVRECEDGECKERQLVGKEALAHKAFGHSRLPRLFGRKASDALLGPAFGLDDFEDFDGFGGIGGLTSWIDGDSPLSEDAAFPPVDSVTRTVEVREENGQRRRKEVITRCHNGKCATQVVHDGEGETTGALADGVAASPEAAGASGASAEVAGTPPKASASGVDGDSPKAVEAPAGSASAPGHAGVNGESPKAVAAAPASARGTVERQTEPAARLDEEVAKRAPQQGAAPAEDSAKKAAGEVAATPAPPMADLRGETETVQRHAHANGQRPTASPQEDVAATAPQHERGAAVEDSAADAASASAGSSSGPMADLRDTVQRHAHANGQRPTASQEKDAAAGAPQYERQAAQESAVTHEVAEASEPSSFDSVVRTVVIKEVNGRREETETIERCRDGKCTKEVRRLLPDGEESSSTQEYSLSAQR